jgi:hypothetical protein
VTVEPSVIPKIQIGQRQISLFYDGVMPFDWAMVLALTVACVMIEPQVMLKLYQNK